MTLADARALTNADSIGSTVTLLAGAGTLTNSGTIVTTADDEVLASSGLARRPAVGCGDATTHAISPPWRPRNG